MESAEARPQAGALSSDGSAGFLSFDMRIWRSVAPKTLSLPGFALQPERAAHFFDQPPGDGQPQAGSAVAGGSPPDAGKLNERFHSLA